jgi:hypothetical protein
VGFAEIKKDVMMNAMKLILSIVSHALFFIVVSLFAIVALLGVAYEKLNGNID